MQCIAGGDAVRLRFEMVYDLVRKWDTGGGRPGFVALVLWRRWGRGLEWHSTVL